MNRTLLIPFFLIAQIGFSQPTFEMGPRIDAPLVGGLTTQSYPQSCLNLAPCGYYESAAVHPAMGLSFSIPIWRQLRARADPVYQRVGINFTSYALEVSSLNGTPAEFVIRTASTANRWQFPVLVESRILRHVRLGVGPDVSLLTDLKTTGKRVDPFSGTSAFVYYYTFPPTRQAIAGAAAALEFPFRLGKVTLAPELRYKRWFDKHYGANWMMDEFTGGVAIRFSR